MLIDTGVEGFCLEYHKQKGFKINVEKNAWCNEHGVDFHHSTHFVTGSYL